MVNILNKGVNMKECTVKFCEQQAYSGSCCYFHQKVKDGLFGDPNSYTECIEGPELILRRALSNPSNFEPLKTYDGWSM